MAQSRHLQGLTTLVLRDNPFGGPGLLAIAEARAWPHHQKLSLLTVPVTDNDLQQLADAVLWPNLEELDLSGTAVTVEGLASLLGGGAWPHLIALKAREILPKKDAAAPRRRLQALAAEHRPGLGLLEL